MHTPEQKTSISFLSSKAVLWMAGGKCGHFKKTFLKKSSVYLPCLSSGAKSGCHAYFCKSGWDVNVFYNKRERVCLAVIHVLCQAVGASSNAAKPTTPSPVGPRPSALATSSVEIETGGWEFVFTFLIWMPEHWVSVTRGRKIKKWLSPHLFMPTELMWDLPKDWKSICPSMSVMSGEAY